MGKIKDLQKQLQKEKNSDRLNYFKNADNLKYELGELISEARTHHGCSQKELAALIGTQQPSIARIERGSNYPSFHMLKKIADALGTYLIPPKFGFMEEIQPVVSSLENFGNTGTNFISKICSPLQLNNNRLNIEHDFTTS